MPDPINRRAFLSATAAAGLGATALGAEPFRQVEASPADRHLQAPTG